MRRVQRGTAAHQSALAILWFAAMQIGFSSASPAATWTSLGPPGQVLSVAADAQNPQVIYAALNNSGVWKTIDGGSTWAQTSAGLPLQGSFRIVLDPFNSSVVYASTGTSGVYKTVTGGETWSAASVGLPAASSGVIAISPSRPALLLVSVAGALFESRDASVTWQPVGPGLPAGVSEAKFSPDSSDTIIVGVSGQSAGLFRSLDSGSTWSLLPLPISNSSLKLVGPIAFDPQNPIAVYAGSTGCGLSCFSSLYKSNDRGTTWTSAGFTYSLFQSIAVDTTSAITIAALSVVFRSTDGGLTWIEFDDGLLGNSANSLDRSQDRLYAATDSGVFVAVVGPQPTLFHTIFPCRLVDTRESNGPYGGPALSGAVDRAFVIRGQCAIPDTARAVAFNLTITQPSASGDLRVYRQGNAVPTASMLNWRPGQTRANSAILNLGASGEIAVHVDQPTGGVHLVIDATGYFE